MKLTVYLHRRAVELKPLHPETRGLLGEVYGLADNIPAMRQCIDEAVAAFGAMDSTGISPQSVASVYHKLATAYLSVRTIDRCSGVGWACRILFCIFCIVLLLQKELSDDAIPLLELSLRTLPSYLPAIVDITVAHYMSGRRAEAMAALSRLREAAPSHASIKKFHKAITEMQ